MAWRCRFRWSTRTDLQRDGSQSAAALRVWRLWRTASIRGFNPDRFSLLDRGFVYAIAHIRGGEELGKTGTIDGKLLKKKNTFTDFIACAEHLIAAGLHLQGTARDHGRKRRRIADGRGA